MLPQTQSNQADAKADAKRAVASGDGTKILMTNAPIELNDSTILESVFSFVEARNFSNHAAKYSYFRKGEIDANTQSPNSTQFPISLGGVP